MPSDRADSSDLADLGFPDSEAGGADAALMKEDLRNGVRQDLAAAAFLWQRCPRHARRLLQRAGDVLDWLASADTQA